MKKTLATSLLMFMFAGASGASTQALADGTLDKIAETGEITVGYRDGAVPFSYYDANQKPIGYTMDLCARIVDKVKTQLNKPDLKVSYMAVTGTTRIPLLANGTIDLECGTTTNNPERWKQVSFALAHFVAGVRILSKADAPIQTLADAKGKTVVTLAGTTSVKILNEANNAQNLGMRILAAKDLAEGMLTLQSDRAVALVFDDVSIASAAATSKNPKDYVLSKEALSVEPYGIMLRRDDEAFKKLVDDTLAGIYKSDEIKTLYAKWFTSPIPPNNINLNFPMPSNVAKVFANPTDDSNPESYR